MSPRVVLSTSVFLVVSVASQARGADQFLRGDSNADGQADISDSLHMLGCLFLGKECPQCRDAADVNDDGVFEITDPIALLNYLFQGGKPPAAPFPRCGPDPTGDRLDCGSYPGCAEPDPEGRPEGETAITPTPEDQEGEKPLGPTALDETPGSTGLIEVHVTVEAPGVEAAILGIESVQALPAAGAPVSCLESLLEVRLDATHLVEALPSRDAPPGAYAALEIDLSSVRTISGEARAELEAGSLRAALPAGTQVVTGQKTAVLLTVHVLPAGLRAAAALLPAPLPVEISPAQLAALEGLRSRSAAPFAAQLDAASRVPRVLEGSWDAGATGRLLPTRAVAFLESNRALFRLGDLDRFEVVSQRTSRRGDARLRLRQLHDGVPVEGADVVVHVAGGAITFVNGSLVPDLKVPARPSLSPDDATAIARRHLMSRFRAVAILELEPPRLAVYSSSLHLPRGADPVAALAWVAGVRTARPAGHWRIFVDAAKGEVLHAENDVLPIIPVDAYDANDSEDTSDHDKWYEDDEKIKTGSAPADVASARLFAHNFYLYLSSTFGIDSIDDGGMKMTARAYDPLAQGLNACWDCRSDQTIYLPGWVTSDVVGHEFGHGIVEKLGGGLKTGVQAKTLNEFHADAFSELLDYWMEDDCNWKVGLDKWGNAVPTNSGYVRDMANPSISHIKDFNWGTTSPYVNIGIPSKVIYLLADGGTHNGVSVAAIGKEKTQQLLFATLTDSGLSSSATFEEYRAVMLRTCQLLIGDFGITSSDCRQVYRAWASVGLAALVQPIAGAVNEENDRFGTALASGDFNGDGYEDLAVGAPLEDYSGGDDTGVVFVFFGSASGLTPSGAEIIAQSHIGGGANADGDELGSTLAVGDFDADGYDDLALGLPRKDVSGSSNAGMVKVCYGRSWGFMKDGAVTAWEGFHQGYADGSLEPGDEFGRSLAAGDFNGNGVDDLAVGIPQEDIGSVADSGLVNVFYGKAGEGLIRTDGTMSWESISQTLVGAANEAGDRFGWSLAAGNFDGDAYADLAIGVPHEDVGSEDDAGVVNVAYGSSQGLVQAGPSMKWERLTQAYADATVEGGDHFAYALAAGDFNGDERDDLAVGSPHEDFDGKSNPGNVIVFYGSGAGLYPVSYERFDQSVLQASPESGDEFGLVLASGNLNGDDFDELVLGVPYENYGGFTDNGLVMVLWGKAGGILPASWQWYSQSFVGGAEESNDRFGWALAAGDFDGDGRDDLAASAPWEDFPEAANAGAVYLNSY
ncbi:MAG: FG-GAP repeat protein [Planctomycetes bacterium]|nr:FG-GAP repeat protein [Planctomycetota bacterium]